MKPRVVTGFALVLLAGGLAGCGDGAASGGKGAQGGNAGSKPGSGNPITAPVDYLGAVGAAQKQAARVADLTPVQQAVQAFQAGEDRLPATLQELVTEGYLPRLPSPPAGSRLAYDPATGRVKYVAAPGPAASGPVGGR